MLLLLLLCLLVQQSFQHGRLLEPPSRASMWRLGFPTPQDLNDNEGYCGGFGVQHFQNGGRCGICGDPWHLKIKAHEAPGGIYANGIITKIYKQGSFIPVVVDVTANHQGYFEFKICPNDDIFSDPDQSCFDRHGPLWVGGGDPLHKHRRHPIYDYETGLRLLYIRLPLNVTCDQCILQWTYVAGNNWGDCEDGTSGMGCGPQEHFRSCADIAITPHPFLKSLLNEENQEYDDESEEDVFDGSVTETEADEDQPDDHIMEDQPVDHIVEEKEAQLRNKKLLLEKVLRKIRQLINQSEIKSPHKEKEQAKKDIKTDQMKSESRTKTISFSEILPMSNARIESEENSEPNEPRSGGFETIPWWDRITSNRH